MPYVPYYSPDGKCGAVKDLADSTIIPRPSPGEPVSSRWMDFVLWDVAQPAPLDLSDLPPVQRRRRRTLLAIRTDLAALTTAKKNAVWTDLTSGSPPRWATDAGLNAASIAVLTLMGASATLSAADVLEAKLRGVAMYCQDNPAYLVAPIFDLTLNIPGDEPDV